MASHDKIVGLGLLFIRHLTTFPYRQIIVAYPVAEEDLRSSPSSRSGLLLPSIYCEREIRGTQTSDRFEESVPVNQVPHFTTESDHSIRAQLWVDK